jgi:hypothetical protein
MLNLQAWYALRRNDLPNLLGLVLDNVFLRVEVVISGAVVPPSGKCLEDGRFAPAGLLLFIHMHYIELIYATR